ncbi:MAG: hypothetical protein IJ439_07605 [Tyzzerella sp.]|nr:hypothetical protein [Tyzzerella sp.]
MKKIRNKKFLLALLVAVLFATLTIMNVFAEDTYNFGSSTQRADRLEAEDHNTSSANTNTASAYASGKVVQMGGSCKLTFTVNAETAGDYVMKFGYYTGSTDARMTVTVNDGTAQDMGAMRLNAWATTGKFLVFFQNYQIQLKEGTNTVVIQNKANYTDVDFVEFYKADSVYYYPIERQQMGMQTVGERIEAEWGYVTYYANLTLSRYDGNSNVSGCHVALTNSNTYLNYTVYAEEAGEYYLQIANSGDQSEGCNQNWEINGESKVLAFQYDATGTGDIMQTKHVFEVNLNQGINTIVVTKNTGTVAMDWFKFTKKGDNVDTIIQAEDYAIGAVKTTGKIDESVEIYNGFVSGTVRSFIDGYVTEFSGNRAGSITIPVVVEEDGYYDLYARGYTGTNGAKFLMKVDDGDFNAYQVKKTGWLTNPATTTHLDNSYRIYLTKGEHTLVIKKDTSAYIDLDWFYITKSAIGEELQDGKLLLYMDDTYNVGDAVMDAGEDGIVKFENGTLVPLKGGKTTVYHQIQMNDKNNYLYSLPYTIDVQKATFENVDQLEVEDYVLVYNGKDRRAEVVATAPDDGWKIVYHYGKGNYTDAGIYDVAVRFVHDNYKTIRKDVKLTIMPASAEAYNGNELIVEDAEYTYNGERQYVVAEAPKGWTIEYVNNGRKNVGSQEVTVYFNHQDYETITKTAILTIKE